MSDHVWFNVYVTVREGQLEEFRAMARDRSELHRENTPEFLAYEWFFTSEDSPRFRSWNFTRIPRP